MAKRKNAKGNSQQRRMLIQEAARLMYEEGVSQYFEAKNLAVKRLLGQGQKRRKNIRSQDLPSNGEISEEIMKLAHFYEGDHLSTRLFDMRLFALDIMSNLIEFKPKLIGSVSTGKIRKGSDIDIHVFTDNIETLLSYITSLNWQYERKDVVIKKGPHFATYTHLYLHEYYPVELSVYPIVELRVRGPALSR